MSESAFFQDLAVLMSVAGVIAVVFQKLRWPKVIGYLLSGVVMSAHTWGGSFLADEASAQTVGQLGIVFLMLTLGLGFSATSMKKVKGVAAPIAVFDTVVMIWAGYTVGTKLFGWGTVQSLFLGAAICDSATTLLAKTIDEMGWKNRAFVKHVMASSVLEDVMCVGVIALVTGVAGGGALSFGAAGLSLGALAVFFVCTVVIGMIIVPRLLNAVAKTGDESLVLTLLGCCFFVSWIAYKLDFSLALGAFLMGVLGAASEARERLIRLVEPLRSMFAAVFFVTIGCLVNPGVCLDNIGKIAVLSAVVMGGKCFNCFTMSMITGQRVKPSVQTAFGLAQIGEFAYMVALLYMTATGDTASPMYQIVVAVSLITTCLNPFMLKISDPVGNWAERNIPLRAKKMLEQYHTWFERVRNATVPGESGKRIRKNILLLIVYLTLIFAFSVIASMLCAFDWSRFSGFFNLHKKAFFALAANLAFLTLLKPVWTAGRRLGNEVGALLLVGVPFKVNDAWRKTVIRAGRNFTLLAISLVTAGEIAMLDINLMPEETGIRIGIAAALLISLPLACRYLWPAVSSAGAEFTAALETESRMASRPESLVFTLPGDHYARFKVSAASPAVGLSIKALDIRAKTGASVVAVLRGGERNRNPGADWSFEIGDEAEVIGSPRELAAAKDLFGVISVG